MIPARKNFLGELLVFGICRRSLWRSFHSVQLRAAEPLPAPPSRLEAPVIFYSNHNTWWDGYLAHIIIRQVYGLDPYLMMDQKQLRRYPFFGWAGCFGVNRENPREALKSVDYISAVLPLRPGRALWIFPQGEITPQEKRPLDFQTGLGHIIRRVGKCHVYPVAFRFEFMREQFPDIFISVGPAQTFNGTERVIPKQLSRDLELRLTAEQDRLREDVSSKNLAEFVTIISGKGSTDSLVDDLVKIIRPGKKKNS